MTGYSDQELLALLQRGDEQSFTAIYRQLWPSLIDAAYKRLPDQSTCEDIVQNVFIDLWNRKDKVTITNLPAYLHTAIRFQVYTHLRRSSSNAPFFTTLEEILESSFAADEKIISAEIRNLITLWLEALPKKRRQIFLLRHLDGLTTQEIADRMDISQKTVQNQLNTAAIDIRARLTQLGVFVVILLYK